VHDLGKRNLEREIENRNSVKAPNSKGEPFVIVRDYGFGSDPVSGPILGYKRGRIGGGTMLSECQKSARIRFFRNICDK